MSKQAHNRTSKAAPRLRDALNKLIGGLRRDLFGGYRPELHYMRGPGPKWQAKHARPAVAISPAHAPAFA